MRCGLSEQNLESSRSLQVRRGAGGGCEWQFLSEAAHRRERIAKLIAQLHDLLAIHGRPADDAVNRAFMNKTGDRVSVLDLVVAASLFSRVEMIAGDGEKRDGVTTAGEDGF